MVAIGTFMFIMVLRVVTNSHAVMVSTGDGVQGNSWESGLGFGI